MTLAPTAVITVAHGRHHHLALQEAGLRRSSVEPDIRCVIAMNDPAIVATASASHHVVLDVPVADTANLPLAAARNRGADEAIRRGAELLIFLDVDCVPAPTLINRYRRAHQQTHGIALLSGPVTYLPPAPPNGYQLGSLSTLADPHPARPNPSPGELLSAYDYGLFWSLSFAADARVWQRLDGFHTEYVGYGGEDTDFAAAAEAAGIPFFWVGGAHAYHQHHPVSDPPVEHLDAIVRNARVFHRRWNRWPMIGWLEAFEALGLIERDDDRIEILTSGKTARPQQDSRTDPRGTQVHHGGTVPPQSSRLAQRRVK